MPSFRDLDEFTATLAAAAERLGISPTAVEKDYWVTQVLRVLQSRYRDDFVFKGGTSLSKGYGILERFSDDIDILILPAGRGRGSVDRLMKSMAKTAAMATGGQTERHGGSETGIHRASRVTYPANHSATDAIATSVLLEMGVRGGPHPHEQVAISSMLGHALASAGTNPGQYDDLSPFSVAVLHPGRTLLEKLYVIHGLAQQVSAGAIDAERLRRHGRHFYDIYKLLGHPSVFELLADRAQTTQIMASIEAISQREFGAAGELRPAGGFAASPAFDHNTDASRRLQHAYESIMRALYFGTEPLPGWDEICARIRDQQHLL